MQKSGAERHSTCEELASEGLGKACSRSAKSKRQPFEKTTQAFHRNLAR
jgi:hypothetical protein